MELKKMLSKRERFSRKREKNRDRISTFWLRGRKHNYLEMSQ